MKKQRVFLIVAFLAIISLLCGCGTQSTAQSTEQSTASDTQVSTEQGVQETTEAAAEADADASVSWNDLTPDHSMELLYADQFTVDYYKEGYKYITIEPDQKILLVPEGKGVPGDLPEDVVVLQMPLDRIYLVATGAMDYFRQLGCIDHIRLSSQKENNWYISEAKDAMNNGEMLYAGKYSAPDYELILSEGCDLAIENTMIYHTPEVLEKLQDLGIPAIIEHSSYEAQPLGRVEWLKLYAALMDEEDAATAYYNDLIEQLSAILSEEGTGKTVAFFYINTSGSVNVRKASDYLAKAIDMAGGTLVTFDESEEEENALSTMTIQMETFYSEARDADILIYNSTIDSELNSLDQLLQKSPLLADFKAVEEGNVWCMEKNFYQESLQLGQMIMDVHKILTDPAVEDSELAFLHRLQ